MTSESVRRAVRPPITVEWRRAALLGTAALLLLAVYGAVRATGGAPNPLVHFAYLAIALAAVSAGWRGGLLAANGVDLLLKGAAARRPSSAPKDALRGLARHRDA